MPTTPPPISPSPDQPVRGGGKTLFSARVDAFITWLIAAVAQFSAVASNVFGNANEAYDSAQSAAASATSAATAAGAVPWVSGATYAQYFGVIDPFDFQTYRRKVAGAGTTAPSLDTNRVNWEPISVSQAQLVAISLYF